jgi:hypothetical protein
MVERSEQVAKEISNPSKSETGDLRLLALEIRPRKAGFAVFEGATLQDWGVASYGPPSPSIRRIGSLIDLHEPSVIIIRRRSLLKKDRAVEDIGRSIQQEAARRTIQFWPLDAFAIRTFFAARGQRTKHEIASQIADWFPELAWKLRPKRKPWQSEPHNAALFDAVAIAVTFLTTQP